MTIRHVASMWWTKGDGISSMQTNLRCFFSFHVLLIIHRIPLYFRALLTAGTRYANFHSNGLTACIL